MTDVFTETSHESWFSRIGGSLKSLLFGLLLFLVSFPLLFWNEGRAVTTARSLAEGEKNVVSVSNEKIESTNEGKLIHTSGTAVTDETLRDDLFSIELNAIHINRVAEMYQWHEKRETRKKKKLGGGETTETTYRYEKKWSPTLISSNEFRHSQGHENPDSMPIPSKTISASKVMLGAFQLPASMVSQISGHNPIAMTEANVPEKFADQIRVDGGGLYYGRDPASPQIGDMRIRFSSTPAVDVSLLAQQHGDSFQPYQTRAGDAISRLEMGNHSAEEMFAHAQSENSFFTWVLRAVGTALMLGGLMMLMNPISVLGDIIPIVGSIVQGGSFFIALMFTVVLAPLTIAIAWVAYRPLIAVPLLALSAVGIVLLIKNRRKKNSEPEIITLDESALLN